MPIMMRYLEGQFCPLVFCDHCAEQIADGRDGNVQWVMDPPSVPVDRPLFFTHKRCSHAFELARPTANPGTWGWCPLELLPIQIGNHLKLNWKQLRETARIWSMQSVAPKRDP